MPDGVSLVVPAWNEERRIGPSLNRYISVLEGLGLPYEIIVVVDGTTDRTAEVAHSLGNPRVKVMEFKRRLGKGGALAIGLTANKFEIVGYLDADSPIAAEDIGLLIDAVKYADAAVASRRLRASVATGKMPLARRVFRVSFNVLCQSVLGLRVHDTQCGAKFFRSEAVHSVLPLTVLRGWAFDAALLFQMQNHGYSIREIPVKWNHDADSKLPLAEQVPIMFLSIFFIRLANLRFLERLPNAWTWWFARNFMKRVPLPPGTPAQVSQVEGNHR